MQKAEPTVYRYKLPAMLDRRRYSPFLFTFFMFLCSLKLVDFDDTAFQGNPVCVIQVSVVYEFSHGSLQFW